MTTQKAQFDFVVVGLSSEQIKLLFSNIEEMAKALGGVVDGGGVIFEWEERGDRKEVK